MDNKLNNFIENIKINRNGFSENESTHPLSKAQERLWFLNKLDPNSPANNIAFTYRVNGSIKYEFLKAALMEICHRHCAFRIKFSSNGNEIIQTINSISEPIIEERDYSNFKNYENESFQNFEELVTQELKLPFNLSTPPMVRVILYRITPVDSILIIIANRLVCDKWSGNLIVEDIATMYKQFESGNKLDLEMTTVENDSISFRSMLIDNSVTDNSVIEYWQKYLEKSNPFLELPTTYFRPSIQSYTGKRVSLEIPKKLQMDLVTTGVKENIDMFSFLFSAFNLLLYRYSGQTDILIGTQVNRRSNFDSNNLIGSFLNFLILRSKVKNNLTFRAYYDQFKNMWYEIKNRKSIPIETLFEKIEFERKRSHSPLFQVLFNLTEEPNTNFNGGEIDFEPLNIHDGISSYDLSFEIVNRKTGLEIFLEYNVDLFSDEYAKWMLKHYITLLESILDGFDKDIHLLSLVSNQDLERIVSKKVERKVQIEEESCIIDIFLKQPNYIPESVALVFNDIEITYKELTERVSRLAHYLESKGVNSDTIVVICMERSIDFVEGLLAILMAGGTCMPLEPTDPQNRLLSMMQDSRAPIILTHSEVSDRLPIFNAEIIYVDRDRADWKNYSEEPLHKKGVYEKPAFIFSTSGTTGKPKGVLLSHRAICSTIPWVNEVIRFSKDDRHMFKTSVNFVSLVRQLIWPLLTGGGRTIIVPAEKQHDFTYLAKLMLEKQISVIHFIPSVLEIFLDKFPPEKAQCLKHIFCGAEILSEALRNRVFSNFSATLHNLYATSEAPMVTYSRCQPEDRGSTPLGNVLPGVSLFLLDSNLQPVPVGIPGEICISGISLANGYLRRPKVTNEKFISMPLGLDTWPILYRSGDLAHYNGDGTLKYVGRADRMVKIRGFRVELGEIEAVLNKNQYVTKSLAVMREDTIGSKKLIAYIIPKSSLDEQNREGLVDNLFNYLRQKIPNYMIPTSMQLLNQFPLKQNGKIDLNALPLPELKPGSKKYISPSNPIEEKLILIWLRILGVEKIGILDDFYNLGGDSIDIVRLIIAIEQEFSYQLPSDYINSSLNNFNIKSLADLINSQIHLQKET